uniref:Uncharacterized protein n=1 Tax=Anguilla anguilla TaxID=7936 RepID=A0A0E9VZL1_ANGAN
MQKITDQDHITRETVVNHTLLK